jgi:hypothetical protein
LFDFPCNFKTHIPEKRDLPGGVGSTAWNFIATERFLQENSGGGRRVWLEGHLDGLSVHRPAYYSKQAWAGGVLGEFSFYNDPISIFKLPS